MSQVIAVNGCLCMMVQAVAKLDKGLMLMSSPHATWQNLSSFAKNPFTFCRPANLEEILWAQPSPPPFRPACGSLPPMCAPHLPTSEITNTITHNIHIIDWLSEEQYKCFTHKEKSLHLTVLAVYLLLHTHRHTYTRTSFKWKTRCM